MEILNQKYLSRILLKAKQFIYLCSVVQCVKLSSMIKNFEKWREVVVLKKYGKENDF